MAFPIIGAGDSSSAEYIVENSLRLDGTDARLVGQTESGDPFESAGNRRTWTFSCWVKFASVTTTQHFLNAGTGNTYAAFYVHHSGTAGNQKIFFYAESGGSQLLQFETDEIYLRDPSAWYHLVLAVDTTQGTNTNRVKLYINGNQTTEFKASNLAYPSQNTDLEIGNNQEHHIGPYQSNGSNFQQIFSGYMAEVYFIDGTQYAASDFGEFDSNSGIWKPKDAKADLTFGTNGVYLEFKQSGSNADASGRGADTSGNGNHFGHAGFADASTTTTDTPTNNFATINPLIGHQTTYQDESEGALKPRVTGTSITSAVATMAAAAGKWYYEVKVSAVSSYNYGYLGWCTDAVEFGANERPNSQNGVILKTERGDERVLLDNATQSTINQGNPNYATGVFIGLFADLDNGNFYWLRNGSLIASLTGETSWYAGKMVMPYNSLHNQSNPGGIDLDWNFGNPTHTISSGNSDPNSYGNFEYTTTYNSVDYYAWCTKNLAEFGG